MKQHPVLLAVLILSVSSAALPAMAQGNLYDNGPVNGEVGAAPISSHSISDSFYLGGATQVSHADFYAWLTTGGVISSVTVQIGTIPFGILPLSMSVVPVQSDCFDNSFPFTMVCKEDVSFPPINLPAGFYWITLSQAVQGSGKEVGWDINSGVGCDASHCPSTASIKVWTNVAIPSEAFGISF